MSDTFRFAYLIEPPFCYRLADGMVTGCDVEVARHVARELGFTTFAPIETEFAQLLPGLEDGRWDVTTGMFVTTERSFVAEFCRPVWALADGLLVAGGNPHSIAGYATLARESALRLAVVKDQVQHLTALALGVPPGRIDVFGNYAEAASAVRAGNANAYASVAMAHRGHLGLQADGGLSVADVPLSEKAAERGAFAVAKGNAELREGIDAVLAGFLGTPDHRVLMARFGFTPAEIDAIL